MVLTLFLQTNYPYRRLSTFVLLPGLANASITTPEPVIYRPMFGAHGLGPSRNSVLFVSQACLEHDIPKKKNWRVRYGAASIRVHAEGHFIKGSCCFIFP